MLACFNAAGIVSRIKVNAAGIVQQVFDSVLLLDHIKSNSSSPSPSPSPPSSDLVRLPVRFWCGWVMGPGSKVIADVGMS